MARIQTFQGSTVQNQGVTGARHRSADFGPSALAVGMEGLGKVASEAADKIDQIEDVRARVEANRLSIEHSEITRQISRRVKETQGEGAEAVALEAQAEYEEATKGLLGQASPRAQLLLEADVATRRGGAVDSWLDHAYSEKGKALESSSVARVSRLIEDASDEDDETKAVALLADIPEINQRRADFFGKGKDWVAEENGRAVSGFYKSRAVKIATSMGENGGANAAIQYAVANRKHLSDEDYNAIVGTYDEEALKDWAFAKAQGMDPTVAGVTTVPLEGTDPLAPIPEGAVQEAPGDAKPVVAARADPNVIWENLIVPNEGRTRVRDNNGAWVQFGINAAFNPELADQLNRGEITEAQARNQYIKKYWERSGADQLPPALAAVHIDTFYLNEVQARKFLRESGGDVDKYMELRNNFLAGLHRKNPNKYPDYTGRNNRVKRFADSLGDGGALPQVNVQVNTSVESVREAVFNTKGVSMRAKRAYFDALVSRKQALKSEQDERETLSARALTLEVAKLGKNFTSLTQLPQDVLLSASPNTLASLLTTARNNVEAKPEPIEVQQHINFVQTSDPEKFASPDFLQELVRKGAKPDTIASVAAQQGTVRGNMANPKAVDPLSDGSLWTIAKPAFEAQGLLLDTVESKGGVKRSKEKQEDAARRDRAVTYLRDNMTRWMRANPGKRPDDEQIRQWTGRALLNSPRHGNAKMFELNDVQLYEVMPANFRQNIIRRLYGSGPRPPAATIRRDVTGAYRDMIARGLRGEEF